MTSRPLSVNRATWTIRSFQNNPCSARSTIVSTPHGAPDWKFSPSASMYFWRTSFSLSVDIGRFLFVSEVGL